MIVTPALLPLALAEPVAVDASRSVVLTNSETLAMGGAGVGGATGSDGAFYNPAAAASRGPADTDPLTYSTSFSTLSVGPKNPVDLGNIGTAEGWSGGMFNLGGALGYRDLALSVVNGQLRYYLEEIGEIDNYTRYTVNINQTHINLSGALWEDRLVLGGGVQLLRVGAENSRYGLEPDRFGGVGLEAGLRLRRPHLGLGLVWRQGVTTRELDGVEVVDADEARVPMELALGLAWRGELTPGRAPPLPLRVAADLVYAAPVDGALMLEALMLGQEVGKGAAGTLSPRLGAELEPWPDRLRLRAGTYLEPSRTALASGRMHGTGGLELRLFHLSLLNKRISLDFSYEAAVDAAPRYLNLSYLGLGTWSRAAPTPPSG